MIDRLHKLAVLAAPLRLLMLVGCALCFLALVVILIRSQPGDNDQYLLLSTTGLLWSLSGYAFILNFRAVPPGLPSESGFFQRLRRRLQRSWYWLLALVFVGTTLTALGITIRLLLIWLRGLTG